MACSSVSTRVKIFLNFHENMDALAKDMEGLKMLKNDLKKGKFQSAQEVKLPTIAEWLKEAEAIEVEVKALVAEAIERSCQNFRLRYKLSKRALEISGEVKQLVASGIFKTLVAIMPLEKALDQIPAPSIAGSVVTTELLEQFLSLLKDDGMGRIGIWGKGGVGKTTLVKNFINMLLNCSLAQPFDIVIWVTVSKDLDLRRIQSRVAERLRLPMRAEESTDRRAIQLFKRLNKEKKFLLILDDVWEKIDLEEVGVPQLEDHPGCKIILTTRSQEVCRAMKTDNDVKVNPLSDEEAWHLFRSNSGDVVNLDPIKPLAKAVTRQCNGLPLAIIMVGRAMRGKTKVETWKDALSELRQPVPLVKGIDKEVILPLKWSYDSLEGMNIKPCFLYCCLFPEDFSVEVNELIQCWVAEGLLDKQQNLEDSFNSGNALIEILKERCMLENGTQEGTVKMHDVVRDVSIWIATSSKDEQKFLVQSGIGLSQIPDMGMWNSFRRVSFVNNTIRKLPDYAVQCSMVSTLLLQGNLYLEKVPEGFLEEFTALRVLNLSETRIRSLPCSLKHLNQLRALLLRNCHYLEQLPPVGALTSLEILDLCSTRLKELPKGMGELSKLRQLNLSNTLHLETIEEGTVSRLYSLEHLDMNMSGYIWDLKNNVAEGMATFEELGSLQNLFEVYISLAHIPSLDREKLGWLKRLKKFNISVGSGLLTSIPHCDHVDRRLVVGGCVLNYGNLEELLSNTSALVLDRSHWIPEMCEKFAANRVVGFTSLKSLTITHYKFFERPQGYQVKCNLLPNLEELNLFYVDLPRISELTASFGSSFSKLRRLQVVECQWLTVLIPFNVCSPLKYLEEIKVSFCNDMTRLIGFWSATNDALPRLRVLELKNLPNLTCIRSKAMEWPNLERIEVKNCPLLMDPLLSTQNDKSTREMKGEPKWWNKFKLRVGPYFQPRSSY